jgi:hypothetical protein
MRKRVLTAAVVAAGFVWGFEAVTEAASDHTPVRSQRVTLIGCVAQTPDGAFQLTNVTPASTPTRSTGANSAKGSTPIGNAAPAVDRPRTAGTTTPKGSTPVGITPVSFTAKSSSSGANSPKASTPVARSSSPVYALDAGSADVASHAGYTVEVIGALQRQRVLKVETLRPVSASCAQ